VSSLAVNPGALANSRQARLLERMAVLRVREEDFEEGFARSSGPGGQNVNKTSTAVVLAHRPTGLQVRCETERSQWQNRIAAREMLLDKIEARRRAQVLAKQDAFERSRRQRRKRPRGLQQRILEGKARRTEKKSFRRKFVAED
jgi:protein subunit release factor B